MVSGNGGSPRRARRTLEMHLGGACELRCAVCDCHATVTPDPMRALEGGGARLVLRGAPSGAPERFRQVAQAARARGFVDVVVRTNALSFMDPDHAAALAATGVTGALVPLFSTHRGVHDRIADRRDALAHTLVGMRALAAAGLAIEIEVPLLSPRVQDAAAVVALAHAAVPTLRAARFFVPARRLPAALAPPSWGEGGPVLAAALRACRRLGVAASLRGTDGVPLCALRDAPELHDAYRFDPKGERPLSPGSTFGEPCSGCAVRAQCPGNTASYVEVHGAAGLAPYAQKPREMYAQRSGGSPVFTAEHHRATAKAAMVVLRPTVNCNQDCTFCSANETSNNVWTEPGTMLRVLARAARRGVERVSFSGGEPTLSKDLVHYVAAAHRLGFPKIEIVTNGVLLDDARRVRALRDAGLSHAFVSLHAHDERVSRVMTQKIGDHARTVLAIEHLVGAGVETVINHVVTARNYPYLKAFVEFAHAAFGGGAMISFAFVTPQYKALEDLSLIPKMSDVAPYLRDALRRAVALGQAVVVGSRQGMPPCFLGEFAAWSDVLKLASEASSEDAPQKQRGPACADCRYVGQCTGLWKPYVARYGVSELRPIEGPPFSREELDEIHASTRPLRWGAPLSFEGLHERTRDRLREAEGASLDAPTMPPIRALPMLAAKRSRPLRVALIGSGRQARRIARALANVRGLSLDAVASPSAPLGDGREFGGCPTFRTMEDAIDAIRPEALIIASSTASHHALAQAALARGIPTLLEKPLTRTEEEAEDLVRASAAYPTGRLVPAHNMVFPAGIDALVDTRDAKHVSYAHRTKAESDDGLRAWSRSGLFELLFHALSLVGHLVGGGVPIVTRAGHEGDAAPRRVSFDLCYADGDATVSLDFAATAEETLVSRHASAHAPPRISWRRAGQTTTVRTGDREVVVPRAGSDLERLLTHFRDVVLEQAAPAVTPAHGLDVMRGARAVIDALAASGVPFDRPNAPRHVASPGLLAFPRSPSGAR